MRRPVPGILAVPLLLLTLLMSSGCGGRPNIDLDRVLEIVGTTMQEPVPDRLAPEVPRDISAVSGASGSSRAVSLSDEQTSAELNDAFLQRLAENLNRAQLIPEPLGVRFDADGAIVGFTDADRDMTRNGRDRDLFKVQVDAEGQRLVATDLEDPTIHRDYPYAHHRGSWGGGYWGWYALGAMSGRQDRYYRSRPYGRPNFSAMSMAPRGYARPGSGFRRSASARSLGGSRSFSGGK